MIFIHGSKHYEGFSTSVNDSMKLEEEYMSKIVEGCVTTLIDINRVYIKNVGNLFIESFDLSLLLQFNNKTSTNLIISRCQYYSIVRKCFFYEFTQNYWLIPKYLQTKIRICGYTILILSAFFNITDEIMCSISEKISLASFKIC